MTQLRLGDIFNIINRKNSEFNVFDHLMNAWMNGFYFTRHILYSEKIFIAWEKKGGWHEPNFFNDKHASIKTKQRNQNRKINSTFVVHSPTGQIRQ